MCTRQMFLLTAAKIQESVSNWDVLPFCKYAINFSADLTCCLVYVYWLTNVNDQVVIFECKELSLYRNNSE